MTLVQQNLHCMLEVVLVTTMVTLFSGCNLTPYHNEGLLQVGLISGSIVLNMILHYLLSAFYRGGGGSLFLV
jgi:hypothetical protein